MIFKFESGTCNTNIKMYIIHTCTVPVEHTLNVITHADSFLLRVV